MRGDKSREACEQCRIGAACLGQKKHATLGRLRKRIGEQLFFPRRNPAHEAGVTNRSLGIVSVTCSVPPGNDQSRAGDRGRDCRLLLDCRAARGERTASWRAGQPSLGTNRTAIIHTVGRVRLRAGRPRSQVLLKPRTSGTSTRSQDRCPTRSWAWPSDASPFDCHQHGIVACVHSR